MCRTRTLGWAIGLLAVWFAVAGSAAVAAPTVVGPEKCQKCHEAEYKVWEGTKHFKSFKDIHKRKNAKAIAKAVGGKRMKRTPLCATCHYTAVPKKPGSSKLKAVAGPSCESCHGPASEWIDIHNNFGGPNVKAADETPEHKAERIKNAVAAGMIRPDMLYDVAANCFSCHGLANPALDGEKMAAMLDAGHPINPNFELVAYSQGSVRHRFYPPDVTRNQEMTPAELARTFLTGHAVSLVRSTAALSKTDHAKYQEAMNARIASARAALEAVKGAVAEAAALLGDPTDENARAFVAAIRDKDLSAEVGGMLPSKDSYK